MAYDQTSSKSRAALSGLAFLCIAGLLGGTRAAQAHPHIFINAGQELIFDDQGRLSAVRARWAYDEMFTLLMVEDGGFDTNGNGAIDAAELPQFRLWDADWPDDFAGDMVVEIGGTAVSLERPTDWEAAWEDGRAISMHTRVLSKPQPVTGEVIIRAFDPDYYTAYTITEAPKFTGRDDCSGQIFGPDIEAIPSELRDAIAELSADVLISESGIADSLGNGLPAVGEMYAEEVRATCGP
ncbi:DUF1007 family protein [Albirhodobacter sp. R86504]|uniref:DUF1007 family protein n=1 Tax=Albirhodobacter sp. R86504 TaxID=3093848 RepID=UPI00366C5EEA